MKEEILFLKPVLKEMVWGGSKLRDEFEYGGAKEGTGECWGISAHPNGDCVIANGSFKGMTLSQVYQEHRELFGNLKEPEFPLLVKIIDTKECLSIQVHPDDAYAQKNEKVPFGKTECWYIMDCPKDACLVIGHRAKTREELENLIHQGKYEELIRRVKVQKGDFLQIEPGTVHAIEGGFTILETQQNSDITYRVYDYGRLVNGKERPLHVKESIQVIKVPDESDQKALSHTEVLKDNCLNQLIGCKYYKVWKLNLKGETSFQQSFPFLNGSVLSGEGSINGTAVRKGDHFILPSGFGKVRLFGKMELIFSTI